MTPPLSGKRSIGEIAALADRVEAARGPDRELDRDIAVGLGWRVLYDAADPTDRVPYYQPNADRSWVTVPLYTFSLDAAMTLVPEGWFTFLAGEDRHSKRWIWHLRGGYGLNAKCRAQTRALALTAAALRAHILHRQDG